MFTEPLILPLNVDGTIYALKDEKGKIFGTGTREVCETLVLIFNNQTPRLLVNQLTKTTLPRGNIRAAIVI
jgi:hypothetical protein